MTFGMIFLLVPEFLHDDLTMAITAPIVIFTTRQEERKVESIELEYFYQENINFYHITCPKPVSFYISLVETKSLSTCKGLWTGNRAIMISFDGLGSYFGFC